MRLSLPLALSTSPFLGLFLGLFLGPLACGPAGDGDNGDHATDAEDSDDVHDVSDSDLTETGSSECGTGTVFEIPRGSTVVVDGELTEGEWDDAVSLEFVVDDGWVVAALVKYDEATLQVAYRGLQPPSPVQIGFPELLLDTQLDGGGEMDDDDWWFHVSFTDCAANAAYDDFDGCEPVVDGWEANNYPQGNLLDVVELRIEFDHLGMTGALGSPLGLALRLSDTNAWSTTWPDGADPGVPATWTPAALCGAG